MALQYPGISYLKGYDGKISDVLDQWLTGVEAGRNERDEGNAGDLIAKLFSSQNGGGQQLAGSPLNPSGGNPIDSLVGGSHQAVASAEDPMLASYFANTRRAESGGNDMAKNPNSSATGRYQFLDATWADLAQRHPELGLTPDGRNDPVQQEAAMKAFTMDNARQLKGVGVGVNPGTLYAAHFLGAGGASKVLGADPNTPVASIVGPEVIQANPQLANMTVADFQQWAAGKGGNGSGGYAGPAMATPSSGGQQGGVDPQLVSELFANRSTRPLVAELLNNQSAGQVSPTADMQNYQFAQANPGFAEFMNGNGSAAANAPAEVQTYLFYREQAMAAGQTPVSFLEFKTALKEKPEGGVPNATIAKEIFEADEGAQAGESVIGALDTALTLNKTAWDGPAADFGTQAGALFGDKNSVDTQQLKNVVIAQALDQLKATFGGMPTEGERKILLDIQGSVTQPREVRERIFTRAKAAAERRIKFNKEKAAGLRSGEYFDDGYSPVTPVGPSAAPTTEDILKKYGL